MKEFSLWLLGNIPEFLSSEPIMCLWGVILFAYIFKVILSFRDY